MVNVTIDGLKAKEEEDFEADQRESHRAHAEAGDCFIEAAREPLPTKPPAS